jgi:hypothetical protein
MASRRLSSAAASARIEYDRSRCAERHTALQHGHAVVVSCAAGEGKLHAGEAEKPLATRYPLHQHENDVARRASAAFRSIPASTSSRSTPSRDARCSTDYVGNTDFSIYALHNVVVVQMPDRTLWPVPHDFDMSGRARATRFPIGAASRPSHRGSTGARAAPGGILEAEPFRAKAEMFARIAGMSDIVPDAGTMRCSSTGSSRRSSRPTRSRRTRERLQGNRDDVAPDLPTSVGDACRPSRPCRCSAAIGQRRGRV